MQASRDADRVSVGLRLSQDTFARIHNEAEARGVGFNWLCQRLLEEGLERLKPAGDFRLTDPHD